MEEETMTPNSMLDSAVAVPSKHTCWCQNATVMTSKLSGAAADVVDGTHCHYSHCRPLPTILDAADHSNDD